jgi:hypothetical protein
VDRLTVLYYTASSVVNAWEFVYELSAVISSNSYLFSVSVSEQCGTSWCGNTLEQHVLLYVTHVEYTSATKCQGKFHDERFPNIQKFINLLINLEQQDL